MTQQESTAEVGSRAGSAETNGRDLGDNPFDAPTARENAHKELEDQNVTEERLKRWAVRWFAVEDLPLGQGWARRVRHGIAARNAGRDPLKYPPALSFTGDQAVKADATDEQLSALRDLSAQQLTALREREAAELEATRLRVRESARRINASRHRAAEPPHPVRLTNLLNEPDEGSSYRIAELWPAAGRVLLAAQYKSGKSTMVGNVIRALVDGGRFLGRFDVAEARNVALIDTELDKRTLRSWLRDQGITNTAAVSVLPLRGAVSTFDILDPATRAQWAECLSGTDVVILDCLRPVLDSLGLSEDKDAGRVLVAFDALLADIGASEGMIVTHMGHQNERARGDSRLLDWPDALWKIVRGSDGEADDIDCPRYLSAIGRDVALAEGLLAYDNNTRRLTYAGGTRRESTASAALPELLALVRREPGQLSKNATEARLKDDHGVPQRVARGAINKAIKDGLITVTHGKRNAKMLFPGGDPFALPDPDDRDKCVSSSVRASSS